MGRVSAKGHWPEYLMEAAEIAIFMVAACCLLVLFEHPDSHVRRVLPERLVRRALMGLAMGGTAAAIVFSPLGKRSGAHFNPAVTLTFWRLKRVASRDAAGYIAFQFLGAAAGIGAAALLLGQRLAHESVRYAATRPGESGALLAFLAEGFISFVLMTVVLRVSSHPRWAPWTGIVAGCLVAAFVTFEAPISGTSMNPARSFGSAAGARTFDVLWLYFLAPPLGMLLAAEVNARRARAREVPCAKLHHANAYRCIFRCGYAERDAARLRSAQGGAA